MTDHTPGARLNLWTALKDGVADMPRIWRGAWPVLAASFVAGLVALWFGPNAVIGQVAWAVSSLATLVAITALAMIGVGQTPNLFSVQFGAASVRVGAAFLLNLIFILMIASVVGLLILAIAGAAGMGDALTFDPETVLAAPPANVPAWKMVVTLLTAAAGLLGFLLIAARLSLFAQATVDQGAVVSVRTMAMTRGAAWPLLAGILITEAPKFLLIGLGLMGVISGHLAAVVWIIVLVWIQAPLTAGFFGSAWRQIARV